MPYLIYDAVIALILLFFGLRGRSRGLVLALCSLLAVITAFWGAGLVADALTPKAVELVLPKITSVIERQLQRNERPDAAPEDQTTQEDQTAPDSGETTADSSGLKTAIDSLKLPAGAQDAVDQALKGLETVEQIPALLTAAIARATAETLVRLVIFLVSFALIMLAWTVFARALDLVAKLPVLHFFNRTGGFLLGLLKGGALLFLAAWLARYLGDIIPQDAVDHTYLLRYFMTTNPLSYLAGI